MHWSRKRSLRSVNALKLWDGNPRLEEDSDYYVSPRQIIKEIFETAESEFLALLKSIAEQGWLDFDTIVVVANKKNELTVLEGNRRVSALKLFQNPNLAPKEKRASIKRYAAKVSLDSVSKVPVCIAPSFKDAMYFITQRHTGTPIDKWKHEAQMRWLLQALSACGDNIEEACRMTGYPPAEFKRALKITQIHDYAKQLSLLMPEERDIVSNQHKFPLTTFIRVLNSSSGKQFLQLQPNEQTGEFKCLTSKEEFDTALAFIIREIISCRMNSRTISSDKLLQSYIEEYYGPATEWPRKSGEATSLVQWLLPSAEPNEPEPEPESPYSPKPSPGKTSKICYKIPSNLTLESENERLCAIFHELKNINYGKRPNTFGVLLRVFLDIAISDYIESYPGLYDKLGRKAKGDFKKLSSLQYRIAFLQEELNNAIPEPTKRAIEKFLNYKNIVSLDTLNFYIHGDIILPTKEDLKNQWNMIFEFTKCLLTYKEN